MTFDNPYASPQTEANPDDSGVFRFAEPYTAGTITPRFMAAGIDQTAAFILAVVAAQTLPEHAYILKGIVAAAVLFAYYLIPEGLSGRTLGKLCAGIVVVQMDGTRITWRQAIVRTVFRLIDVNPFLLGALPGVLSIVLSQHRQRFGDRVAGTVVVRV